MAKMFFLNFPVIVAGDRKFVFRDALLWVNKCRALQCPRFTCPLAHTLKRFATALRVFILYFVANPRTPENYNIFNIQYSMSLHFLFLLETSVSFVVFHYSLQTVQTF